MRIGAAWPWDATYGTMLAELEVQRTIKSALSELVGPSTTHTDNMGILDGLWRSEEGCIGQTHNDADPDDKKLRVIDRVVGKEGRRRQRCQGSPKAMRNLMSCPKTERK